MEIDIPALPSVDLVDRLTLKECEAVYFILDANGDPLYIGSTVYLKSRLGCHRIVKGSPENGAVSVAWFACDWATANEIEHDLIFKLKPPLNVRGKHCKLRPRRYP